MAPVVSLGVSEEHIGLQGTCIYVPVLKNVLNQILKKCWPYLSLNTQPSVPVVCFMNKLCIFCGGGYIKRS